MALPALTLPFAPARTAASPDGSRLLLVSDDGALWQAPLSDLSAARDTGIRLPTDGRAHHTIHIQGCRDFSRIAVSGSGLYLAQDLDRGAPLSLPPGRPRSRAALSPDGRWRLSVDGSGIAYTDGHHTGAVPAALQLPDGYLRTDPPQAAAARTLRVLDQADTPVTRPQPGGAFELLVACYGHAVSVVLRPHGAGLALDPSGSAVIGGLVYDPSELIDTSHLALVRHGYGSSVAALSADRAEARDFHPHELMSPGYGAIEDAIADRDGPRALISTRGGRYLWTPSTRERRRVFLQGQPVLLRGDRVLVCEGRALSWQAH